MDVGEVVSKAVVGAVPSLEPVEEIIDRMVDKCAEDVCEKGWKASSLLFCLGVVVGYVLRFIVLLI